MGQKLEHVHSHGKHAHADLWHSHEYYLSGPYAQCLGSPQLAALGGGGHRYDCWFFVSGVLVSLSGTPCFRTLVSFLGVTK